MEPGYPKFHTQPRKAATPASTSQQSPTRTRLAYLWPLRTQSLWSLSLLIWWSLCVWYLATYLATPYSVKKIHPGMFEWYTPRYLDWWSKPFKLWCWNFGPHTFWAESPLLTDYKGEQQHFTVYVPWFNYVRIKSIPATWYFEAATSTTILVGLIPCLLVKYQFVKPVVGLRKALIMILKSQFFIHKSIYIYIHMRPWSFSTVEDFIVLYICTNGCRILLIAVPKHVAHFKMFTKLSNAIICSEKKISSGGCFYGCLCACDFPAPLTRFSSCKDLLDWEDVTISDVTRIQHLWWTMPGGSSHQS